MLLIGRQNRPRLYALEIQRPAPLTAEGNWFTVRERIAADGSVVQPLDVREVDRLVETLMSRGLKHVAVCLLFSFVNPEHEKLIGDRCTRAGLTVSLSSDVIPEFREYERASTTVINASLRPTVEAYLRALADGLSAAAAPGVPAAITAGVAAPAGPPLRIMHSAGGTLSVDDAGKFAARLVLSGPAGGVIGARLVADLSGERNVITYDMGGTSTDVAAIIGGNAQWTTANFVDGLPLSQPSLDIETVGAGGGSIAFVDAGGALRVGPKSAGAQPGPACYGRGGELPTVTDANVVLGRIVPDRFLGGAMVIHPDLARRAIAMLATSMGKSPVETALGIVRVAEANMASAIRAVTARRGHDPRSFALLSFGGAGGLHACALADALDIPRVIVPPYSGVLSALGMVAAAPVADASQTVVHLGDRLDDARLAAEYTRISGMTLEQIPYEQTESVEAWADVRFRGQSHELKVRATRPMLESVEQAFRTAYVERYGSVPDGKPVEIATIRVRRIGRRPAVSLPMLAKVANPTRTTETEMVGPSGQSVRGTVLSRGEVLYCESLDGPMLVLDNEATTFVPPGWIARAADNGTLTLVRREPPAPP
jgi:N-methylhydantoinase A